MKFDRFSIKLLIAGGVGLGVTFGLLSQYSRAVQARVDASTMQIVTYRDLTLAAYQAADDQRYSPEARKIRSYILGDMALRPSPWTVLDAQLLISHMNHPISPRAFGQDADWSDIEPVQIFKAVCASIEARVQGRTGPIEPKARALLQTELVRLEQSVYPDISSYAAGTLKVLATP